MRFKTSPARGGYYRPDGSAAQRQRWFRRGYETGRFDDCDTFKEADL